MLTRPLLFGAALALLLSACSKPAPQSADSGGPLGAVRFSIPASEPMPGPPAPDAKAGWSAHANGAAARYGFPGQTPLLMLACREGQLIVTRPVPAEIGAQALFAVIGGGQILRLPVDATSLPGERGYTWQGAIAADDPRAAVFTGNGFDGTLPGAGKITVAGSDVARKVVRRCRGRGSDEDASPLPLPSAPPAPKPAEHAAT